MTEMDGLAPAATACRLCCSLQSTEMSRTQFPSEYQSFHHYGTFCVVFLCI